MTRSPRAEADHADASASARGRAATPGAVSAARYGRTSGLARRIGDGLAYCAQPRNLVRTTAIALVVGLVLTAVNQADVILAGDATTATWFKCGLNFVVPFCVANLGLLSARGDGGR